MSNIEIFNGENDESFENISKENSFTHWFARDLMIKLGYDDYSKFRKVIEKAIQSCISAQISLEENFLQVKRNIDGNEVWDYKLSRFACYLTALNGDTKKPEVAKAQAYFVKQAEILENYVKGFQNIDRLIARDEIKSKEVTLSGVVQRAGIESYGLFQNAGYRGLYNMNMSDLKRVKGLQPKDILLDFMGITELAANLFRITQTEDKIRENNIQGQRALERTAEEAGNIVRQAIIDIKGTLPEYLPKEQDIKTIKKGLKAVNKDLKKIDKKKK